MNKTLLAVVASLGALLSSVATSLAASGDGTAAAARAQSAFFKGDASSLQALVTELAPWGRSADEAEQYAYALVNFRWLQHSVRAKRDNDAKSAGGACVATLDTLLKRNPKSFEAHALQSACYGYLANLGGMAAIRNGSRSGKSMEAALALAPQNPRVVLLDGFGVYFRPKFVGGDPLKGCQRFAEAVRLFGVTSAGTALGSSPTVIEWGSAEAHYWQGRCQQQAGDAAAAKQSYQRALVLADDFVAARRALASL